MYGLLIELDAVHPYCLQNSKSLDISFKVRYKQINESASETAEVFWGSKILIKPENSGHTAETPTDESQHRYLKNWALKLKAGPGFQ